jgi:Zn-dependent protease
MPPRKGREFYIGFGQFRFSGSELLQLLISALVISLIFAYPFSSCSGSFACALGSILLVFLLVGSAFVIHESSHKLTAQHYGVWSEYRMWGQGLLLALIMKIALGFSFIAPGAAYFEPYRRRGPYSALFRENYLTKDEVGKIGWAGPMSNIVLAVVLFALTPVIGQLAQAGIEINLMLALFNLIPFGLFDGQKIFSWNWKIWLATVAAVIGMQYIFLV